MKETLARTHYAAAANLIKTILSAVEGSFENKEIITRSEVRDAFDKIRRYMPNTGAVFESTCRDCVALNQKVYAPDRRRKDFVTRLLFSRIANQVPARAVVRSERPYPHVLIPGFQAAVQMVFTKTEYVIFNKLARDLYAEAGTDADEMIWRVISQSETMAISTDRIFIRFLQFFRNFQGRYRDFMTCLQKDVDKVVYKADEYDFCDFFDALFGAYEAVTKSSDLKLRVNTYHGEECAQQIGAVFLAYKRFRESLDVTRLERRAQEAERYARSTAVAGEEA